MRFPRFPEPDDRHLRERGTDRRYALLVTATPAFPDRGAKDIIVVGAPGAILAGEKLVISPAASERAELAARYWLSFPAQVRPNRVICVAGRPAFRSGMPQIRQDESEAPKMIDVMIRLGVPIDVIRPNSRFPLNRDFSASTVDEMGILVQAKLISPEWYSRDARLGIVLHRRHGARAIDILRKFGFRKSQLLLLSPETLDSRREIAIRLAYRMLVLGTWRQVAPDTLRRRERRLVTVYRLLGRPFHSHREKAP